MTETRISARLLTKVVRGQDLTRRERKQVPVGARGRAQPCTLPCPDGRASTQWCKRVGRQLVRSAGDMFRLVPFVIIVIIPFAEFALPFLLRFFPNMLPSTFEHDLAKEEKRKKLLDVRIEMAKFLQDAVEEMALQRKAPAGASQFDALLASLRSSAGAGIATDRIVEFSRLFGDELTLDNLSRQHLLSLCKFLGVTGAVSLLETGPRCTTHRAYPRDLGLSHVPFAGGHSLWDRRPSAIPTAHAL